jgi:hypothetical protein
VGFKTHAAADCCTIRRGFLTHGPSGSTRGGSEFHTFINHRRTINLSHLDLFPDWFYEERRRAPRWQSGVLPDAGIWLLEGDWRVAAEGSAAEAELRAAGALRVAGLRFGARREEGAVAEDVELEVVQARRFRDAPLQRRLLRAGWGAGGN